MIELEFAITTKWVEQKRQLDEIWIQIEVWKKKIYTVVFVVTMPQCCVSRVCFVLFSCSKDVQWNS